MKFKEYIDEAAYQGNLGFQELAHFYQVADEKNIKKMERIIKKEDWNEFKKLIKKVIGVKLI